VIWHVGNTTITTPARVHWKKALAQTKHNSV
jgi:hypothetical protein